MLCFVKTKIISISTRIIRSNFGCNEQIVAWFEKNPHDAVSRRAKQMPHSARSQFGNMCRRISSDIGKSRHGACIHVNRHVIDELQQQTGGYIPKQLSLMSVFRHWSSDAWAIGDVERLCYDLRKMIMRIAKTARSKSPAPPRKFKALQHLVDRITLCRAHDEASDTESESDAPMVVHTGSEQVAAVPVNEASSTDAESTHTEIDLDELAHKLFRKRNNTRFRTKTRLPSSAAPLAPEVSDGELDRLVEAAASDEAAAPLPSDYRKMPKIKKKPGARPCMRKLAARKVKVEEDPPARHDDLGADFDFETSVNAWVEPFLALEHTAKQRK